MSNSVNRGGDEVWLHDMLGSMEEAGLLGEFCRYLGLEPSAVGEPAAEIAWLAIKDHFTDENGVLGIADACRAVLQFPPTMSAIAGGLTPKES